MIHEPFDRRFERRMLLSAAANNCEQLASSRDQKMNQVGLQRIDLLVERAQLEKFKPPYYFIVVRPAAIWDGQLRPNSDVEDFDTQLSCEDGRLLLYSSTGKIELQRSKKRRTRRTR